MPRYKRGYIKQDLHDSLLQNVDTDIAAVEASVTTIQTQLATCTQSIVTGSRALGTNYQNTSGKIMFVSVALAHLLLGAGQSALNKAYVEANDTTPDTAVVWVYSAYAGAASNNIISLSFIVPPGSYYMVSDEDAGGGSSSISAWTEWTLF